MNVLKISRPVHSTGVALAIAGGLSLVAPSARAQGDVTVAQDLLPLVAKATKQNTSAVEVKNSTPAGGVLRSAVFEHPKGAGAPARVTFPVRLPAVARGERLVFAFDVALSDGVPWQTANPPPDGVGFSVRIDGKPAYSQKWKKSEWHPGAVDLTRQAGRKVEISLLVDPLKSGNYDWALWGRPRLLRVKTAPLSRAGKNVTATTDTTVGFFVADAAAVPLRRVRLIPDTGDPVEWKRESETESRPLIAFEYEFPKARRVRVVTEPAGANVRLATAAFAPQLRIETVSCVRALPLIGERTTLRVTVRNVGRGMLPAATAMAGLTRGGVALPPRPIPRLAPGMVWRGEWPWRTTKAGRVALTGSVAMGKKGIPVVSRNGSAEAFLPPRPGDVLASGHMRLEFVRGATGYAGAIIRARQGDRWVPLGSLAPLFRIAPGKADPLWEPRPSLLRHSGAGGSGGSLTATRRGPDNVLWNCTLKVALDPAARTARLRYEWKPAISTAVHALWGPNVYVGDGTTGEASSGGLFPGLEFLSGGEISSNPRGFAPPLNERFTPTADKITIPLMAVSVGADSVAPPLNPDRFYCPDSLKDQGLAKGGKRAVATGQSPLTVALLWDNDIPATRSTQPRPSTRFCSPNLQEGMANHRLGLFLPSCPEFVPENADRSARPYAMVGGKTVAMTATLTVTDGAPLTAVRAWLNENGGVPAPAPWPHTKETAYALSRDGLMKTVWNPETKLWRAMIEAGEEPIPGIASLLYLDSRTVADPDVALRSRSQMEEGIAAMVAKGGPGSLYNRASSHILRWELPFLYGYLPAAMDDLEKEIRLIQQAQQPDGGWRFRAGDPQHASLGKIGDGVSGLASHHAWMLMRYARITGDAAARAAGERALRWIGRFQLPRGASVWECPIYEPDILAADWNLAACLEGYRATGNPRWLHDAVYWAETGLPFVYLWSRPDRPAMLGASIATYGTTFYTHSWLETPVQWEGLIYGYNLLHLADALQKTDTERTDSPLPLSLKMTPNDWRRVSDLVFVSGLHQQVTEGARKGTYPDSITDFKRPNPFFINPENLMVHLLTRDGHDPNIKTVQVSTAQGPLRISSGADMAAEASEGGVRLRVRYFAGSNSQLLLTGPAPKSVRVGDQEILRQEAPVQKETGWSHDARKKATYLSIPHTDAETVVDLQF